MISYDVQYTNTAVDDLKNIIHYISHILKNDVAALKALNTITNSVDKLDCMPERFPLIDKPISKRWGDRKMAIKKYIVIYNIDEKNRIVWIVRIMNSLNANV